MAGEHSIMPNPGRVPLWTIVRYVVSLGIAVCFLFSGLIHFGNSYFYLSGIIKYDLTSPFISKQVAIVLPVMHLLIALLIIGDFLKPAALLTGAGLFCLYACAQISILLRGINIECGCFGISSQTVDLWSVANVTGFCLITIVLWAFEYREKE